MSGFPRGGSGGGSGTITDITSNDSSVTIVDPHGPITDLSVPAGGGAVSSVFTRTGAVVATTGDYTAAQVTNAADKNTAAQQTFNGNVSSPAVIAAGLTGSLALSRYCGATAAAAPTTGAHSVGDWGVIQTGGFWICTAAGTPGTFSTITSGGGGAVSSVFSRTGAVVALNGDYNAKQVGALPDGGVVLNLNLDYGLVARDNTKGQVNCTAVTNALADAVTAIAAGTTFVSIQFIPDHYYFDGALNQATASNGISYNTEIPIPIVGQGAAQGVIQIKPMGYTGPSPYGFFTKPLATWEILTTGAVYDATHGTPSLIGATAWKSGFTVDITKATWLTFNLQSITFLSPANPSLGLIDDTYIDSVVYDDCHAITNATLTSGHYTTQPTHPTAFFNLGPMDALDRLQYRGQIYCQGMYAGPAIGELCDANVIFSLENVVGMNFRSQFTHPTYIAHYIDCRNVYGITQMDPNTGVVSATGAATFKNPMQIGVWDIEYMTSGIWTRTYDINDPNNAIYGGPINFFRVLAGGGAVGSALLQNGGGNLRINNLAAPGDSATGWQSVAFQNSWVQLSGAPVVQYRKDQNGYVHLDGLAGPGNANVTIFTLPAGYRPGNLGPVFATLGSQGSVRVMREVDISTGGAVSISNSFGTPAGSQDWIDFAGITFLAEN